MLVSLVLQYNVLNEIIMPFMMSCGDVGDASDSCERGSITEKDDEECSNIKSIEPELTIFRPIGYHAYSKIIVPKIIDFLDSYQFIIPCLNDLHH